jgi:hypothetical protein
MKYAVAPATTLGRQSRVYELSKNGYYPEGNCVNRLLLEGSREVNEGGQGDWGWLSPRDGLEPVDTLEEAIQQSATAYNPSFDRVHSKHEIKEYLQSLGSVAEVKKQLTYSPNSGLYLIEDPEYFNKKALRPASEHYLVQRYLAHKIRIESNKEISVFTSSRPLWFECKVVFK